MVRSKVCEGNALRIVFGIMVLSILLLAGSANALLNDGGGSWQYYKDITISNTGSALTDYQVLVSLDSSNFPNNAQNSGADIRFTDTAGTELSYWVENWDFSGKSAKIWVKVPSITADSTITIHMYYGNPSATSLSNGEATFVFFDDFENGILDASKWQTRAQNVVEENGYLKFTGTGDAYPVETISNYGDVAISYESLSEGEELPYIFARANVPQKWDYETWLYSIVCCHGSSGYSKYPNELRFRYRLNTAYISDIATPFDYDLNTWYKQEMYVYRDQVLAKISTLDDSRSASLTYTATGVPESGKIAFATWLSVGKIDNVRVRKYASPEPLVSVGDEMPTTIPATINIDPDTLNLKSNGEYITAYIELPGGYDVSNIDVSTVSLYKPPTVCYAGGPPCGSFSLFVDSTAPATAGDADGDGIPDLMVKFSRSDVVSYLGTTDVVDDGMGTDYEIGFTVKGNLADGTSFEGTDGIRVIKKGK